MAPPPPALRAAILLAAVAAACAIVALLVPAAAATNVPAGPLLSNQTWTSAGSPYVLGGDVVVPFSLRLDITAGAIVEAPAGAYLEVQGELNVPGTAGSPVNFGVASGSTSWGGIVLSFTGRATIDNATITGARVGLEGDSYGALTVSHLTIVGAEEAGVRLLNHGGPATFDHLSVSGGARGIYVGGGGLTARFSIVDIDSATDCIFVQAAVNTSFSDALLADCADNGVFLNLAEDTRLTNVTASAGKAGLNVSGSTGLLADGLDLAADGFCMYFRDGAGNVVRNARLTQCGISVAARGAETGLVLDGLNASMGGRAVFYEGTNYTLRWSVLSGAAMDAVSNRWIYLPPYPAPEPAPCVPPPEAPAGLLVACYGNLRGLLVDNVTATGQDAGFVFRYSERVELRSTQITSSSREALWLMEAPYTIVRASRIIGVGYAVSADRVIDLWIDNSTLITTGGWGLYCEACTRPTLRNNTVTGTMFGVVLHGGSGGLVTGNYFFFNGDHASTNVATHAWDDGRIGNLWDDYFGADANLDGIGDTPRPITGGQGVDRYPIMRILDNEPPVADGGPDIIVYEYQPVWFNGWRCSDNIAIRLYLWSSQGPLANFTVEGYDAVTSFAKPGTYEVLLTVIDWGGNRAQDTFNVYVLDRTPPVARAGGNRTVDEDAPVTFDGSTSTDNDPDFPFSASFAWTVYEADGPHAVSGVKTTYTFTEPGNFTVIFVVRDSGGRSASDKFWVIVRDITPPALGPLTAPVGLEDRAFRAYAAPSTDNDEWWPIGKGEWFVLKQGDTVLANTTQSPAVFNVSEPGFYTYWYFVHDAALNLAWAEVTFLVGDATPPDLGAFVDRTVELGEPVTFDLTGITDNDPSFPGTASSSWTIPVPAGKIVLEGSPATYTFHAKGALILVLQVADQSGNTAMRPFNVSVVDTKPPLISAFGPSTVAVGEEARFWAHASDPSGVGPFSWNVTGLSSTRWGPALALRFASPGRYTVRAHVDDTVGLGASATIVVDVASAGPPRIVLTCAPGRVCDGVELVARSALAVAFAGPDAVTGTTVSWEWGDRTATEGFLGVHGYAEPGNYSVTVRVVAASGAANNTSFTVRVVAAPAPAGGTNPGNTTQQQTVSPGLPIAAVAAIAGAAAAAGLVTGFRLGRAKRLHEPRKR